MCLRRKSPNLQQTVCNSSALLTEPFRSHHKKQISRTEKSNEVYEN